MARKRRSGRKSRVHHLVRGGSPKETGTAVGTGAALFWLQGWLANTFPSVFNMLGGWGYIGAQVFVGHKLTRKPKTRAAGHALLGVAGFNLGAKLFAKTTTAGLDNGGDVGLLQGAGNTMLEAGGLQTDQTLNVGEDYEPARMGMAV